MKKILSLMLVLCMVFAVCAVSASADDSNWPSGETLSLWIPAGAGTAQDTWCRLLAEKMEEILDCTIVIENKPGGSGWVCINEFFTTKPDGTKMLSSLLSQVGSGRNPSNFQEKEMWNDLDLLGSMMDDPGCIWISATETRFNDLPSLIEYAKENEMIVGITAVGSDDDIPLYWLNNEFGTKITPVVNSDGTAGNYANLLGGHIDFLCDNLGAYSGHIEDGTMIPLAIFAEEHSKLYPDVPTVYEVLDGTGLTVGNSRGLAMQKGTPEEKYEVIKQAYMDALASDSLKEEFLKLGYEINYREPDDFGKLMEAFAGMVDGYAEWMWK